MKLGKLGLFCILSVTAIASVFAAVDYGTFHYIANGDDAILNLFVADRTLVPEFDTQASRDSFIAALQDVGTKTFQLKHHYAALEKAVKLANGKVLAITITEDADATKPSTLKLEITAPPAGEVPPVDTSVTDADLPAANTEATFKDIKFKLTEQQLEKLKALPAQVHVAVPAGENKTVALNSADKTKVFYLRRENNHGYLLVLKAPSSGLGRFFGGWTPYICFTVGAAALIGVAWFVFPWEDDSADASNGVLESSDLLSDDLKEDLLPGESPSNTDTDVVRLQSGRSVPKKNVVFDDSSKIVGTKKVSQQPETIGTASAALAAFLVLPFFL